MKNLMQNTILAIAGCLILQFAAKAQTNTFPDSGNVGIGTINPQTLFEIHGGLLPAEEGSRIDFASISANTINNLDRLDLFMRRQSPGTSWADNEIFLQRVVDASRMGYLKFTNWDIAIGSGDMDTLFVTSNGNVGIGTATPTHKLTINGAFRANEVIADKLTIQGQTNTIINPEYGVVAIGTWNASSAYKLTVNGAIRAKEVIVETGWADDVFDSGYKLASIAEIESYIEANKRLPGVPSAEEVSKHGISVGETGAMILRKVEELTLHIIEQDKRIRELERKLQEAR